MVLHYRIAIVRPTIVPGAVLRHDSVLHYRIAIIERYGSPLSHRDNEHPYRLLTDIQKTLLVTSTIYQSKSSSCCSSSSLFSSSSPFFAAGFLSSSPFFAAGFLSLSLLALFHQSFFQWNSP